MGETYIRRVEICIYVIKFSRILKEIRQVLGVNADDWKESERSRI
jgi:hypothetical protein